MVYNHLRNGGTVPRTTPITWDNTFHDQLEVRAYAHNETWVIRGEVSGECATRWWIRDWEGRSQGSHNTLEEAAAWVRAQVDRIDREKAESAQREQLRLDRWAMAQTEIRTFLESQLKTEVTP